ncbi:hypothetical protein NQZ68_000074, partial [Dissostichus eleginoides]
HCNERRQNGDKESGETGRREGWGKKSKAQAQGPKVAERESQSAQGEGGHERSARGNRPYEGDTSAPISPSTIREVLLNVGSARSEGGAQSTEESHYTDRGKE